MKTVKKLAPVWPYDIPACQAWMEDMAARGLFLRYYHGLAATFVRDEPAKVRYRLEPTKPGSLCADQETQDNYRLLGWEYVCTAASCFHVWRCNDPGVPELYDDPQVQAMALERMSRARRKSLLITISLPVLWFAFYLLVLRLGGLTMYIIPLWHMVGISFLTALVLLPCLLPLLRLRRFTRRLEKGLPQANRASYRLERAWSAGFLALFCVIVIPSLLSNAVDFVSAPQPMWPLDQLDTQPPYVALAVLDPEAQADRAEARPIAEPWVDDGWQTVEVQWEERPEGYFGTVPYAADCDTRYYHLRLGFLRGPLTASLSRGAEGEALDLPGTDGGFLGTKEDGEQVLVLWRDSRALAVNYTGGGSLGDHLPEYASLLEKQRE